MSVANDWLIYFLHWKRYICPSYPHQKLENNKNLPPKKKSLIKYINQQTRFFLSIGPQSCNCLQIQHKRDHTWRKIQRKKWEDKMT